MSLSSSVSLEGYPANLFLAVWGWKAISSLFLSSSVRLEGYPACPFRAVLGWQAIKTVPFEQCEVGRVYQACLFLAVWGWKAIQPVPFVSVWGCKAISSLSISSSVRLECYQACPFLPVSVPSVLVVVVPIREELTWWCQNSWGHMLDHLLFIRDSSQLVFLFDLKIVFNTIL